MSLVYCLQNYSFHQLFVFSGGYLSLENAIFFSLQKCYLPSNYTLKLLVFWISDGIQGFLYLFSESIFCCNIETFYCITFVSHKTTSSPQFLSYNLNEGGLKVPSASSAWLNLGPPASSCWEATDLPLTPAPWKSPGSKPRDPSPSFSLDHSFQEAWNCKFFDDPSEM